MISRKKGYLLIFGAGIFIGTIWYLSDHTWTISSQDGTSGGGLGVGGRGLSISTKTWKSLSGAFIDECVITYASPEEARKDFEEELKGSGTIIDRTESHDNSSGRNERVVKVFGDARAREGSVEIIKLKGKEIYYVDGVSLKWALRFEKSWLKQS
jgi:hypothetical protein